MKQEPRLKFSKEDAEKPELKKPIRKQQKAMRKADLAQAKLPQKAVKHRVYDQATGKVTTHLVFEPKKGPSKLTHAPATAPASVAAVSLHREMRHYDDENVGVEAAHAGGTTAEVGARKAHSALRSERSRTKTYKEAAKAETKLEKRNLEVLNKKAQAENPTSNPFSRMMQKRQIKKEYAAAKAGKTVKGAKNTAKATGKGAKNTAKTTEKTVEFFAKHKKGLGIVLGLGFMACFLLNALTSCGGVGGGAGSVVAMSTYQAEDEEMLAAEARYCELEAGLQEMLDNYETEHDYDEVHIEQDDIEHDPYVLISMISCFYEGPWTLEQVEYKLQEIFDREYTITEDVVEETRTRTVTETRTRTVTDPETGEEYEEEYEEEVEEEYTYTICTVRLENFNLPRLPVYMMTETQLEQYATYMACLGNRPDLFPDSAYVGRYDEGSYLLYEIPTEALEDETFAAMMEEATKYIGYPYVWGGSSPSTSFDCSGFVSWVINHSGWDVGRLGAQGLCNICTPTSTPHPGDLVFFVGTYNTDGVSHVGIYVGEGMMLHCGDPISYANLSSSYWQEHFYCYGRLPSP